MSEPKQGKTATKKYSPAYADADFALQHAVVRGEDKIELERLRKIRDAVRKY